MDLVRVERTDRLARLIIDYPQRRNAMSRAMWRAIPPLLQQVADDGVVSALVLCSGTPGCFCAGADISEFAGNYRSPESAREVNDEIQQAIGAIAQCEFPTLALIDGACVGGGLALALACDFRLASEDAAFALTPARLGLSYHPDDIRRLVQACGAGNASELLFGAERWGAGRALQAGLVNTAWPSGDFDSAAQKLINSICSNSTAANRVLKHSIRSIQSNDPEAIRLAVDAFDRLFSSTDFIAGRDAFLNKTTVSFPSNQQD